MSPLTAAPQAYRENTVLCATPAQRVVMLYDGARRFLHQAADAMRAREVERAHNKLRQAEEIIAHLDAVLDFEQGALLAEQLHALYNFYLTHLNRARMGLEADKVDEVSALTGRVARIMGGDCTPVSTMISATYHSVQTSPNPSNASRSRPLRGDPRARRVRAAARPGWPDRGPALARAPMGCPHRRPPRAAPGLRPWPTGTRGGAARAHERHPAVPARGPAVRPAHHRTRQPRRPRLRRPCSSARAPHGPHAKGA